MLGLYRNGLFSFSSLSLVRFPPRFLCHCAFAIGLEGLVSSFVQILSSHCVRHLIEGTLFKIAFLRDCVSFEVDLIDQILMKMILWAIAMFTYSVYLPLPRCAHDGKRCRLFTLTSTPLNDCVLLLIANGCQ